MRGQEKSVRKAKRETGLDPSGALKPQCLDRAHFRRVHA